MRTLIKDIRYAVRSLRKRPGFTLVAVITLALGIGVNTAILSTVNGFIIRPLPVKNPGELIVPFWGSKKDPEVWGQFSYANYIDVRDQNQSLSGLCAWTWTSAGISAAATSRAGVDGQAELAWGEIVSGNYFDVLGITPALGRGFLPEEDRTQSGPAVIVLGHNLWQRRFNSDGAIVGKQIFVNGLPFTVVGIGPEKFEGVTFGIRQDFWVPLMMQTKLNGGDPGWEKDRAWASLTLLGRLKSGVTRKQAEADLNLVAGNLARLYPDRNADTKIQVKSEVDGRFNSVAGVIRFSSLIAICVSVLVLLIACANCANLMLARATARTREIGIRVAIGAKRLHIVRQLLTESILLALCGGVLGLVFAFWGTDLVHASIPPLPYPITLDVSPDFTVLKWMFGISLLTGIAFGLIPAVLASRPNLVGILKGEVTLTAHGGLGHPINVRSVLVVAQVATSIVVLVCAGLFVRSLNRALKTDPGFSTENLVTMHLDPGLLGYDGPAGKRFYVELLKRIEAQPGVKHVSCASFLLMGDNNDSIGPVIKDGDPDPPPNQGVFVDRSIVAPKYFETMGIKLVMGRDFNEHDTADSPAVAIVNQEFARRFYGSDQNALGKRMHYFSAGTPVVEIVGIAKDGLYRTFYEDRRPYLFIPEYQGQYQSAMTLIVKARSAGDLKAVVESARHEISQMDARLPVFGVLTGEQNLSYAYWGPRLAAGMGTAFGLLALLLATMGLYSVMTYSVSQRTREIGIRMALGAQLRDVLGLVLRHGMMLVFIGLGAGLIGAFLVTRVLASLLLGIGTTDPITFICVAILLSLVALFACLIPARRATKVDPQIALRYE